LKAGQGGHCHRSCGLRRKAESLAWPIVKILKDLLEQDAYVEELILWLSRWEYRVRQVHRRQAADAFGSLRVQARQDRRRGDPVLEDVNGEARFHAVNRVLAQEDETALGPLLVALENEESFRVKEQDRRWDLGARMESARGSARRVRKVLPPGVHDRRRRQAPQTRLKRRGRRLVPALGERRPPPLPPRRSYSLILGLGGRPNPSSIVIIWLNLKVRRRVVIL